VYKLKSFFLRRKKGEKIRNSIIVLKMCDLSMKKKTIDSNAFK